MTENRWLRGKMRGDLSRAMLGVVGGASERKLRLALCALERRGMSFGVEGVREATELAEKWADGEVTEEEVVAFDKPCHPRYPLVRWWVLVKPAVSSLETGLATYHSLGMPEVLRDIFGNPFRPVTLDPTWRTSTVVALAEGMYESRDFGAMPILADALQDAGCDNDEMLKHCRDTTQPHVRGCWVIDSLTGRN